jgi:hypothetical protein
VVRSRIVELAREWTELSPRELAVGFTDRDVVVLGPLLNLGCLEKRSMAR